ncbi:29a9aeb6-62d2-4296-b930-c0f0f89604b0 [Sclerotinia trifoliorum]|uniref:29a9aeb6-62d2-4296-b930-c0f0f89604b0 n=1 Tax=Sclerotinia trifoliorum TaxID=28548 RepID=A0A8H2VKS2_9HELO|nr:29a9aeb6-62d2-4296-b930-c0f0f89604b0 [Sclerotinia trifoliorum]
MLLHSAAGMHNHEYSHSTLPRPQSDFMPRRSPLNRSSFSNPGPEVPTSQAPIPVLSTQRSRALSEYIPRNKLEHHQVHAVRFQEPEADAMSEDGRSVANSEGSRTTNGGRRGRRSSKASTAYRLAHPAPTLTHKQRLLNIRPKLLMQLQLLSFDKRPKPTLDVLPSTVVVSRLAKRFPRMFRGKGELGANDIMIVKSEEYDIPEGFIDDTDSDEEGFSHRDLIAVICQLPRDEGGSQGKAEIVLGDGSVWLASPLPTGAYEMTKFDESGTKVTTIRWVRRAGHHNHSDSSMNDAKFSFSVIDPNCRRHAILATLTQTKLDIPNYYTNLSSSSGIEITKASVSGVPGEFDDVDEDDKAEEIVERTPQLMDETMRALIQVTGIWVSLRQGWSPYFKYNDSMATFGQNKSPRNSMSGRTRASSLTPDIMRSNSVTVLSGTRSSTPESTFGYIGNKILQCNIPRSNSVTTSSPHDSVTSPRRARAPSAGTAFMQRAASRKINTIASDSEGESVAQYPENGEDRHVKKNASNRVSCPPAVGVVASPPPIPIKPTRRVKSVHMLSSTATHDTGSGTMDGQSEHVQGKSPAVKRSSRWKSFINFIRHRSSSRSPSP